MLSISKRHLNSVYPESSDQRNQSFWAPAIKAFIVTVVAAGWGQQRQQKYKQETLNT